MSVNPYRGRKGRGETKTQRLHRERLMMNLRALEAEGVSEFDVCAAVPEAWDTLEHDIDVTEKKVKITMRLDESVAKFYRAMGRGYQARMNRILASFAQMRIAEIRHVDAQWAEMRAQIKARRLQKIELDFD